MHRVIDTRASFFSFSLAAETWKNLPVDTKRKTNERRRSGKDLRANARGRGAPFWAALSGPRLTRVCRQSDIFCEFLVMKEFMNIMKGSFSPKRMWLDRFWSTFEMRISVRWFSADRSGTNQVKIE
jgi:hypothetical protein